MLYNMNPIIISLLLIILLQITASHPDIVRNTCEKCASNDPNINYTLCMDSFNFTPKSHRANLKGLGVIAMKTAKANAKSTRVIIKTSLKSKEEMSPYLRSCLETCLELYDDAIDSLKDSSKAIKIGHYNDANIMLSSVIDAPGTCEDGFKDGEIKSPLTKENDELFGHSVVALCITAMLQGLGGF